MHRRGLVQAVTAVTVVAALGLLVIALTTDFKEDSVAVELASHALAFGTVWGYSGSIGPSHWGGTCVTGKRQSPIDVPTNAVIYDYRLVQPVWEYHHGKKDVEVLFNGHTVLVKGNYATLQFADHDWKLRQYHFRTPSEHKINNVEFPVEMQMVHRNAEGGTLVVSWFFDPQGWEPAYMPQLADDFPATTDGAAEYNHPVPGPGQVEFNEFISLLVQRERKGHMFYTYEGSMTQPPCTEGVTWLVMTEMIGINEKDVTKLKKIEGKNNRPIQQINGRKIYKSFAAS